MSLRTYALIGSPVREGIKMDSKDKRCALTDYIIQREYQATHNGESTELTAKDFPTEDLFLSLNEFSRKQGWM